MCLLWKMFTLLLALPDRDRAGFIRTGFIKAPLWQYFCKTLISMYLEIETLKENSRLILNLDSQFCCENSHSQTLKNLRQLD